MTFRLRPVLRFRKYQEQSQKRCLAEALTVENEQKETALRYAGMRQEAAGRFRSEQEKGWLDVRRLIDRRVYISLLDRELQDQLQVVAKAELETGRRRGDLAEAMKARKALEVLEDRARRRQRAAQDRAETAEMDEVAVGVHRRGRGDG